MASSRHIPALDGFRGVSVALVLVSHLTLYRAEGIASGIAIAAGALGVSSFFVLSGYLITNLLLAEERSTGGISLKAFYARRVLRIWPAYFTYLLAVLLLEAAGRIGPVLWHDYGASALFVRNYAGRAHETGHLWSVSVEEQFYLLWPLFLVLVPAGARLRWARVAMAAIFLWRAYLVFGRGMETASALYLRSDLRMDSILAGCVLALGKPSAWLGRTGVALALLAATLGLSYVNVGWLRWAVLGFSLAPLCTSGLLAYLLLRPESVASRLLSTGAFGWMGRLSYSLYLWQQLFLAPECAGLDIARAFPLNVLGLGAAAWLSYTLVERPFLRLKERFASARPREVERIEPAGFAS